MPHPAPVVPTSLEPADDVQSAPEVSARVWLDGSIVLSVWFDLSCLVGCLRVDGTPSRPSSSFFPSSKAPRPILCYPSRPFKSPPQAAAPSPKLPSAQRSIPEPNSKLQSSASAPAPASPLPNNPEPAAADTTTEAGTIEGEGQVEVAPEVSARVEW
jgi:hypothetical protein